MDADADEHRRHVTRIKDRYDWRYAPAGAVLSFVLFELGDFPMMRKMLLGVKARAEGKVDRAGV